MLPELHRVYTSPGVISLLPSPAEPGWDVSTLLRQ